MPMASTSLDAAGAEHKAHRRHKPWDQGETVDVFVRLGHDEPENRQILARQPFHELHAGFAQGGNFEPYPVPKEIPRDSWSSRWWASNPRG